MQIPRVMIAAGASGSGKTTITCALLEALRQQGVCTSACKCGPDYIDPLFHREVLGVPSENLDLFFCNKEELKDLFLRHGVEADLVMTEGVMGYYDGVSMDSDEGSSYHVAETLKMPVILVVPCRGMALSVVPIILGMLEFRENSMIRGILLNRISEKIYPRMKGMIEKELHARGYEIPVLGYVPEDEVFHLESRHLGLVLPGETERIREQLEAAGAILCKTVDLEQVQKIAEQAPDLEQNRRKKEQDPETAVPIRIGIARDEAFCFYYEENLRILREAGCELIPFSPLHDAALPSDLDGVILGGGYPEVYAKMLSENASMRKMICGQITAGMPCIAECGGFLYLHEQLEGEDGKDYPMAGVIPGRAFRTGRLGRFGYVNVQAQQDGVYLKRGESIRGHEFHYWDSPANGTDCLAVKPGGTRSWNCVHMEGNLFAGFPHLYFASNPEFVNRFVQRCRMRRVRMLMGGCE